VGEPLFGVKCVSHVGGSFLSLSCSSQLRRSGDVCEVGCRCEIDRVKMLMV
jgi:hypothetical protein